MKVVSSVALALLAGSGLWAWLIGPLRNPQAAFDDFLVGAGRAEDQLADPLILAGPRVRPLVLKAIDQKGLRYRRYAIAYLGCAHYRPSLEPLVRIAEEELEPDYIRADAVEALWRFAPDKAVVVSREVQGRPDFLGQTASKILATGDLAPCRSWWAAFLGRH